MILYPEVGHIGRHGRPPAGTSHGATATGCRRHPRRGGCWCVCLGIGQAWAEIGQGYDTSLPIEITADSLEVRQEEQIAVFRGNVDAVQGDLNLRADELTVYYRTGDEQREARSA